MSSETPNEVTILLSIYHPSFEYLEKQLRCLERQSYSDKKLLIWIDEPEDFESEPFIESMNLTIPTTIIHAEKNLGYIKAFEQLVRLAETPFIAFCDQDDLWDPDKLEKCIHTLIEEQAVLVTSDRRIIDEKDQVLIDSDCQSSPNVQNNWETGDNITLKAATSCMAIGMSIVMRTEAARNALPFSVHTGHDKWLALTCSTMGKMAYIKEPLVSYRRHGANATGILQGIHSKRDYFQERILPSWELAREFSERFSTCPSCGQIMAFAAARKNGDILKLWRMRKIAPTVVLFEIFYQASPDWFFQWMLRLIRNIAK